MPDPARIQELVQLGMAAERGSGPFGDPEGLRSVVTYSDDDETRLVEVRDQDTLVFSSCFVAANAARPAFYPDDVPFENRVPTSVVWSPELGTLAIWPLGEAPSASGEIQARIEELQGLIEASPLAQSVEELSAATAEERRAALVALSESAGEDIQAKAVELAELMASAAPELTEGVVQSITAFHEAEGWEAHRGDDAGSFA